MLLPATGRVLLLLLPALLMFSLPAYPAAAAAAAADTEAMC
jgi:hypothetical protein